jgi:hypothetical protein
MNQSDIKTTSVENIDLFGNSSKRSLLVYVQKIGKIVAAIYLVTDVMEAQLPLTTSLRGQSLELMNEGYRILTGEHISSDDLARFTVRIEQVMTLVEIGSISHHVTPMNADIIRSELAKVRELLLEDIVSLRNRERESGARILAIPHAAIGADLMKDRSFDELVNRHESKRHQNDIKTTLTTQNDITKSINDIKTTLPTEAVYIDRQKEILNALRTRKLSTMADIKLMVTRYSDKTIQRDIASLVEMGLVKREGNKRWAVYSVIG